MKKPTPNPPAPNDTSSYQSPDSKKFHEAAELAVNRVLDNHEIPAKT